jgi:hypothetical protein
MPAGAGRVITTRILFAGQLHVHYGQAYVTSRSDGSIGIDMPEAFAGQANGLCGAGCLGGLFLMTGLHTGHVGFAVELHDQAPPLDDAWQEVVEVSFKPAGSEAALVEWAGEAHWPLDLERVDYRVRYCASGMDEARSADTIADGEPEVDRHLLQLWPSPPQRDQVVRQTSNAAAYWHDWARTLPPPTPEERAEAERRDRLEADRARERQRLEAERLRWGGRLPSDRLRDVGGNVLGLVALDRGLVDAIAAADPGTQRAIARWAARRAYKAAGLDTLDWVVPALDAADRGDPPPPPFDNPEDAFAMLLSDERVPTTLIRSLYGDSDNALQQAMALPALLAAVQSDPLRAALDAVFAAAATFGSHHRMLIGELRRAFPAATAPHHRG